MCRRINPTFSRCLCFIKVSFGLDHIIDPDNALIHTGKCGDHFECRTGRCLLHSCPTVHWCCFVCRNLRIIICINHIGKTIIIIAWITCHCFNCPIIRIRNDNWTGARIKCQHCRSNLKIFNFFTYEVIASHNTGFIIGIICVCCHIKDTLVI